METGTGVRFRESSLPEWWLELRQTLFVSDTLSILKTQFSGGKTGEATVGKIGRSRRQMDSDYVTNERWFNHEMGHVLGLLHEHQRYDRNSYVRVDSARAGRSDYLRIREEERRLSIWCLWFCWKWYDNSTTHSTPYYYHSIMHYPRGTGITLQTGGEEWHVHEDDDENVSINSVWGDVNGNTWFSPWDIYTIKKLYGITPNERPNFTPTPAFPVGE